MTKAHLEKPLNALEVALASNPTLCSVYHGLLAGEDSQLGFCSLRNTTYRRMMRSSIAEELGKQVKSGKVTRAGLLIRHVTACDSLGSNAKLRIQDAWRGKMWLRKEAPNSISRLVPFITKTGPNGETFILSAAIATLAIELEGQQLASVGSDTRCRSPAIEPLGPRLEVEPTWVGRPDRDAIAELVTRFMHRPLSDTAPRNSAKPRKVRPYTQQHLERTLAKFQLETLLPIQKAFIGFGCGEITLKMATTLPLAHAKAAARRANAISRDELVHLFWTHALETGGRKPPLVML